MKIKLEPSIAYLVGLWKARKIPIGLGIGTEGDEVLSVLFAQKCAEKLNIPQSNFKFERGGVFFFHSAYRKYFQDVEEEALYLFRKKNETAASFLAGYFDGAGIIEKDRICFARARDTDQALIERLGFKTVFRSGRLYIVKPMEFIIFVLPFISHLEHKQKLDALVQSGNERDPRLQLRSSPPGGEHSVGTAYVK
jgi:hypothetical protein